MFLLLGTFCTSLTVVVACTWGIAEGKAAWRQEVLTWKNSMWMRELRTASPKILGWQQPHSYLAQTWGHCSSSVCQQLPVRVAEPSQHRLTERSPEGDRLSLPRFPVWIELLSVCSFLLSVTHPATPCTGKDIYALVVAYRDLCFLLFCWTSVLLWQMCVPCLETMSFQWQTLFRCWKVLVLHTVSCREAPQWGCNWWFPCDCQSLFPPL